MPNLFVFSAATDADPSTARIVDLANRSWFVRDDEILPTRESLATNAGADGVADSLGGGFLLWRVDDGYVVAASPDAGVFVNGAAIGSPGLRALRHRDRVACGSLAVYFSTESSATIAPFRGQAGAKCRRCDGELTPGTIVAACPSCGTEMHESDADGRCFSYDAPCPVCGTATPDDGSFLFDPRDF